MQHKSVKDEEELWIEWWRLIHRRNRAKTIDEAKLLSQKADAVWRKINRVAGGAPAHA